MANTATQTLAQLIPKVSIYRKRKTQAQVNDQFTQTDSCEANGNAAARTQHISHGRVSANGQNGLSLHHVAGANGNAQNGENHINKANTEIIANGSPPLFLHAPDTTYCDSYTSDFAKEMLPEKKENNKRLLRAEKNYVTERALEEKHEETSPKSMLFKQADSGVSTLNEDAFGLLLDRQFDDLAKWFRDYCISRKKNVDASMLSSNSNSTSGRCHQAISVRPDTQSVGVLCYLQSRTDGQRTPRMWDVSTVPSTTTISEDDDVDFSEGSATNTQATLSATMNKRNGLSDGGLLLTVDTSRSQVLRPDEVQPMASSLRGSVEWLSSRVPPLNLNLLDSVGPPLSRRESLLSPATMGSQFGSALFGSAHFSASLVASARSRKNFANNFAQTEHYFDEQTVSKSRPDAQQLLSSTETVSYFVPCLVKQVYNCKEECWQSAEEAETALIIDRNKSKFVDNRSDECMSLEEAIRRKFVRVECVERASCRGSVFNLTATRVRVRKQKSVPFAITAVLDKKSGQRVSYCRALADRLIRDVAFYLDTTNDQSMPLHEAIDLGLVDIEFWKAPSNFSSDDDDDDDEESDLDEATVPELPNAYAQLLLERISGSQQQQKSTGCESTPKAKLRTSLESSTVHVFAVHSVIDRASGVAYSLETALQRGIIDKKTGTFVAPTSMESTSACAEMSFEEAVAAGYIVARVLK